jgi:recombination protein RecA
MIMSDDFKFEKKWKDKMLSGEHLHDSDLQSVSTGSLKLDWALGQPFVEGSIVELFGENSVGKTTLALEVATCAQKIGKHVFFLDLERKLRESQLNMIDGLQKDKLTLVYPDNGEEAGDALEEIILGEPGSLLILDSVSALMPEVEGAESHGKMTMGSVARLCAKMMRKVTGPVAKNKCILVFINHITSTMDMFGPKTTTKGGRAITDRASQRIQMSRALSRLIKDEGHVVGQNVDCKVIKNNMNRPFLTATVPIIYGRGIWKEMDIFNFAKDVGIIQEASKGWYSLDDNKVRQSKVIERLSQDADFKTSIINRVKEMYA